jgi:hypothetical protein
MLARAAAGSIIGDWSLLATAITGLGDVGPCGIGDGPWRLEGF